MNQLPSSLKGAAKALGVFILLGIGAAALAMLAAVGADAVGLSSVAGMIRKYVPFRFA